MILGDEEKLFWKRKYRTCVLVKNEKIEYMGHRKKKDVLVTKQKLNRVQCCWEVYIYMHMLTPYDLAFSIPSLRPRMIIFLLNNDTKHILLAGYFFNMCDYDGNDTEVEPVPVLETLVLSLDCIVRMNVVVVLIRPPSTWPALWWRENN